MAKKEAEKKEVEKTDEVENEKNVINKTGNVKFTEA